VSAGLARKRTQTRHFAPDSVIALAFAVVAAAFRIPYLTSKSLWMDEGFSVFMARSSFPSALSFIKHGELNMVLYYALLRLWVHVSITEFWLRLLSAVFSIATVAVVYLLGSRVFGRRAGIISAALVAVHPADVAFAQELRSYSLTTLLISLSFLLLVRAAERNCVADFTAWAFAAALAAYAHFIALFVIVPQCAWLLTRREGRKRRAITAVLALGTMLAPLFMFTWFAGHQLVNWISQPTLHDALDVFTTVTLPGWRAAAYVVLWLLALGTVFRKTSAPKRPHLTLISAWLFLPFALAFAVSTVKPMLVARFFVVCVPAAALLAAYGISSLAPKFATGLTVVAVLLSFNATLSYYRHPNLKEDWRSATRYVLAHGAPNDEIIVDPAYCGFTVNYYRDLDPSPTKPHAADVSGEQAVPSADSVWLLVRGATENSAVAADALRHFHQSAPRYCELDSHQFNLIHLWHFSTC
jgi:uncharacterized membrane protein